MKKLKWLINNIEEILCSSFLALTVILLFTQVFFRYVFGKSIPWTEEMSRYAFMWMVYIGISFAAKEGQHIRVTDHLKLLSLKIQKFVLLVADAVWIFFNFVVIIEGFKLYAQMSQFPLYSAVLDWDMKYVFLIIPVSFIFSTLRIFQYNIAQFTGKQDEVNQPADSGEINKDLYTPKERKVLDGA